MPTLATEDRLIARSTLRHRPVSSETPSNVQQPIAARASRISTDAQPTTQPPVVTRASRPVQPQPQTRLRRKKGSVTITLLPRKRHWMMDFGLGLLAALLLVALGQALFTWSTQLWDNLHYGMPRTYQVDAYVGHEKGPVPSHFIALNLHGQIEVIEIPGGDTAHTHLYVGPVISGENADLVPVTLQFITRSSDRHHPDMLVQAGSSRLLFRNQNGGFLPPTSLLSL